MISDEAVEAAARGIASANLRSKPWEELDEDHANSLRRDARSALEAAAPHMCSDPHEGFVAWFRSLGKEDTPSPYRSQA